MQAFRVLYKFRYMLFATTVAEVRAKYMGTTFGLVWAMLYPFMFLGLYSVVFTMILRVRVEGHTTIEYIITIFCGLVPFIGFSEALGSTTGAVVSNKNLLKNTMFPIELAPVKAALSSSVSMTVGLSALLVILWGMGKFSIVHIFVIPIFLLQILFTIGVGWIVSALNVFFRDLGQMMGILILFLMMISPIAYTREMVPPSLTAFMYPNPLFYIMESYRAVLIGHTVPVDILLVFALFSVATFVGGFALFSRVKTVFAEYV